MYYLVDQYKVYRLFIKTNDDVFTSSSFNGMNYIKSIKYESLDEYEKEMYDKIVPCMAEVNEDRVDATRTTYYESGDTYTKEGVMMDLSGIYYCYLQLSYHIKLNRALKKRHVTNKTPKDIIGDFCDDLE